jgi:murein DD-endopeptidase MepM/ murein hydrolase activator NlpD
MKKIFFLVATSFLISSCEQDPAPIRDYSTKYFGRDGKNTPADALIEKGDSITAPDIQSSDLPAIGESRSMKKEEIETVPASQKKNSEVKKNSKLEEKPVKKASSKFIWPVRGAVIKGYNPAIGNEGISIKSTIGTPVKSALGGEVVFSGDDIKSFGNMVLIKHDGGLISSYAHLSEISVAKGTKIEQGNIIGKIGKTGKASEPQLYFAIKKGEESKNPLEFLP